MSQMPRISPRRDPFGRIDLENSDSAFIRQLRHSWRKNQGAQAMAAETEEAPFYKSMTTQKIESPEDGRIENPREIEVGQGNLANMLGRMIASAIGLNQPNFERDVAVTQAIMGAQGVYDMAPSEGPTGIFSKGLDRAIREYQRNQGLQVDGVLEPGGETWGRLLETLPNQAQQQWSSIFQEALMDADHDKVPTRVSYVKDTDTTRKSWLDSDQPLQGIMNDATEVITKRGADIFDELYPEAARNLDHYLDEKGKERTIPPEEARQHDFIQKAEKTNQTRFEESFQDKNHPFYDQITQLKDGETVVLRGPDGKAGDHWDVEISTKDHLSKGEVDQALATGHSEVKSSGEFIATREGDTITVSGDIQHRWQDRYDFDPEKGGYNPLLQDLEKAGKADSYDLSSEWSQKVEGSINMAKDGEIIDAKFSWEDSGSETEDSDSEDPEE